MSSSRDWTLDMPSLSTGQIAKLYISHCSGFTDFTVQVACLKNILVSCQRWDLRRRLVNTANKCPALLKQGHDIQLPMQQLKVNRHRKLSANTACFLPCCGSFRMNALSMRSSSCSLLPNKKLVRSFPDDPSPFHSLCTSLSPFIS